jgi:SPX domain protein involved in polyphosphate accumulation
MRFEYKYVIPNERLEAIRRDLLPFMVHDPYALREKNHQYTVRSIYFDTPRLDVYHEKIEGLHMRRKLRIRTYNKKHDDSTAFLEIKMKVNQRGMKHRAAVRSDDIPDFLRLKSPEQFILTDGNQAVAQDRARRFLFHIIRASMSPVVLVTYEREAFLGRFDRTLRITVDRHLRFLDRARVFHP